MEDFPGLTPDNPLFELIKTGPPKVDLEKEIGRMPADHPLLGFINPERHKREYQVPNYLKSMLASEVPWEEVAPRIKQHFDLDPEPLKTAYEMSAARNKFKNAEQSDLDYFFRRLPFFGAGYEGGQNIRTGRAKARIEAGKGDRQDYELVAQHERMGELKAKQSTGEAVVEEATKIPALLGEFVAGGRVVRGIGGRLPGAVGRTLSTPSAGILSRAGIAQGAAATPFTPSTWLKHGSENQLANPDQSTFQSYAPAMALAASQNAILGQMQGLLSGAPITRAGRILGKTTIGMGEAAAADVGVTAFDRAAKYFTGKTLGLDTKWGPLVQWARAEAGDGTPEELKQARKSVVVQFATFSLFSAMHSGREIPVAKLRAALDHAKDPAEVAAVGKVVEDILKDVQPVAPVRPQLAPEAAGLRLEAAEKVKEAFKNDKTPIGDLGRAYAEALIEAKKRDREARRREKEEATEPIPTEGGDAFGSLGPSVSLRKRLPGEIRPPSPEPRPAEPAPEAKPGVPVARPEPVPGYDSLSQVREGPTATRLPGGAMLERMRAAQKGGTTPRPEGGFASESAESRQKDPLSPTLLPRKPESRPTFTSHEEAFDAAGLDKPQRAVIREVLRGRSLQEVMDDPKFLWLFARGKPNKETVSNHSERALEKLRGLKGLEGIEADIDRLGGTRELVDRVFAQNKIDRALDALDRGEPLGEQLDAEDVVRYRNQTERELAKKDRADEIETVGWAQRALKEGLINEEAYATITHDLVGAKRFLAREAERASARGEADSQTDDGERRASAETAKTGETPSVAPPAEAAEAQPAQANLTQPQLPGFDGEEAATRKLLAGKSEAEQGAIARFLNENAGHLWFPESIQALVDVIPGRDPNYRPPADPLHLPDHRTMSELAETQTGARAATPHAAAVTTHALGVHVAREMANTFRMSLGSDVELFKGNPAWHDLVQAEMEKPGSQVMTPAERQWTKDWKAFKNAALEQGVAEKAVSIRDEKTHEVIPIEVLKEQSYVHRAVAPKADIIEAFRGMFSRPGSRAAALKKRKFATAAEGVAAGVEYKRPHDAMADFLYQMLKTTADHRFGEDPRLGGKDLVQKEIRFEMAKNAGMLTQLKGMPEHDVQVRNIILRANETNIFHVERTPEYRTVEGIPAMKGKEYPKAAADYAETMYGGKTLNKTFAFLKAVNDEVRGFLLGGDFSFTGIQLLPTIFSRRAPSAVKGIYQAIRSALNPDAFQKWLTADPKRMEAAQEMARIGGTTGSPAESTKIGTGRSLVENLPKYARAGFGGLPGGSALKRGVDAAIGKSIIGAADVVSGGYVRTARALTTALDVTKIDSWIAIRSDDVNARPRQLEALEASLGQGRMKQLGMSPERAEGERLALTAASYYRSYVTLARLALQRGEGGALARSRLASLATGVAMVPIAVLLAMRESGAISEEEFEERLNPERGKFLTVPVPLGDGKRLEIGFGTLFVNIVRTVGNIKKYGESGGRTDNPIIHWYKGHAGMIPRAALNLATGTDYSGRPATLGETAAKTVLPISAQELAFSEGTPRQRIGQAAASFFGLRSFPQSESGARFEQLRQMAQEKYKKPYADLTFGQQATLAARLPEKPPSSDIAVFHARRAANERQKAIMRMVKPETRTALEELGHELPSYDKTLSLRGVEVPMTELRQKQYAKLLAEEYDRTAKTLKVDRLKALREKNPKTVDDYLTRVLKEAKDRARSRFAAAK